MNAEDYQLLDKTFFDNMITKRDFSEIYHQREIILSHSGKTFDFIFGEYSNFYQLGNSSPCYELTLRKHGGAFDDDDNDAIRYVRNAFTHLCEEATVATTGGSKIEVNNYVGPVSTITRVLASKDVVISS